MSHSATLYRITQGNFCEVVKVSGKKVKPIDLSEGYTTFQGSFMALEYILSIGKEKVVADLVKEIFNPTQDIGGTDLRSINFEAIGEEELWALLDSVSYIPFEKVKEINKILESISEEEVANNYNAEELNKNGIYPRVWYNNNAEDQAFNKKHVMEDFRELRTFFSAAAENDNNLLVYVE